MTIGKNLTMREALRMLEEQGWQRRKMDGRHEVWRNGDRSLTIAASGKGGRSAPAPSYLRSILRSSLRQSA